MANSEIVFTIFGAVLAAIIGSLFTMWLQRSQPWIGLISVDRDDTHLIQISQEIIKLTNENQWIRNEFKLKETEPLYKLFEYTEYLDNLIKGMREALDALGNLEQLMKQKDPKVDEQKEVIEKLLSSSIIKFALEFMIQRDELPLPTDVEVPPSSLPILRSEENSPFGEFVVYGAKGTYYFRQIRGNNTLQKVRLAIKIFQHFLSPSLLEMAQSLKYEIQQEHQKLLEIRERLKDAVSSRNLIIKAQIANMGGSPEHIEPFGILKIKSAGKPINPSLVSVRRFSVFEPGTEEVDRMAEVIEGLAKKQGVQISRTPNSHKTMPEYVVVKPSTLVSVELVTIDLIEDDNLVNALENGMLSCQLILIRSGKKFFKTLASKDLVMGTGLSQDKRDELMKSSKSKNN